MENKHHVPAPIGPYPEKALQPNITNLVQKHFQQFESAFADISSTNKHRFLKKKTLKHKSPELYQQSTTNTPQKSN